MRAQKPSKPWTIVKDKDSTPKHISRRTEFQLRSTFQLGVMCSNMFLIHFSDDLYHVYNIFAGIGTHNSSLEGAMKLKFVPFCSSSDALSYGILFAKVKIFRFWPKTMD